MIQHHVLPADFGTLGCFPSHFTCGGLEEAGVSVCPTLSSWRLEITQILLQLWLSTRHTQRTYHALPSPFLYKGSAPTDMEFCFCLWRYLQVVTFCAQLGRTKESALSPSSFWTVEFKFRTLPLNFPWAL